MSADSQHNKRLRIGIDGTCLASARGYGRYLRELLPPLLDHPSGHEYVLVLDAETAAAAGPLPTSSIQPPTKESQAGAASARGNRGLSDMWAMGRAVAKEEFDLMFFPSVYSYFPVFGGTKVAVCLHDTIAERHGAVVFPRWRNRLFWNAKVKFALHQARGILTVSEWSRQALSQHFGLDAARIFVSGEAPAAIFSPISSSEEGDALLTSHGVPTDATSLIYVGGFNPHKNLGRLIEAFSRLCGERPAQSLHLLLVGDHASDVFHDEVAELRAGIDRLERNDRVHWLGFVPDEDLRHLYAHSRALVIPSLEEGFGLPAAEAAACGTPCVATVNSPLPQLLEGAGLFIDPLDEAALHAALARITTSGEEHQAMSQMALRRVADLSWSAAADQTARALTTIAGNA